MTELSPYALPYFPISATTGDATPPPPPRGLLLLRPDGEETTVMIRNIPNRYTREMLLEFLDTYCAGVAHSSYDFVYLPIDFGRKLNKGYAFVNFTSARAAWEFYEATNQQRWDYCKSAKLRDIVCAKIQGADQLVLHFAVKIFDCDSDEYLPLHFSPAVDGSNRSSVEQRTVGRRGSNRRLRRVA